MTDAVHRAGGKIFIQLWHVGRVSHVSLQLGGGKPVAPSAIAANTKTFIETGFAETSEPRALAAEEIASIVADYANGYLIDQFLKDGANKREDHYGQLIENRARFALEVTDAILTVWDKSRVGIRLSPVSPAKNAIDSDPEKLFFHLVRELNRAKDCLYSCRRGGDRRLAFDFLALRKLFAGAYIPNNNYTRDLAIETLQQGRADSIAFGKLFLANPDLVERLRRNANATNLCSG